MQINIIAIGHRMPDWIAQGYWEYAKRLPKQFKLNLIALPSSKKTNTQQAIAEEGQRILAAIPKQALTISLDSKGQLWSSTELAKILNHWQQQGENIALLIGGAHGLATNCQQQASLSWSLSKLTFPHLLVRVMVVEQLYRAWSLLNHHPYHKA